MSNVTKRRELFMLATNVARTKRYLLEGLSIEEISEKIKRPIEYVNKCVRIIEEADANKGKENL